MTRSSSVSRAVSSRTEFHSAFPDGGQNLKPVTPGQHEVKQDHVKLLGVNAKESVLTGMRQYNLVTFVFEALLQRIRDFQLIFYDKDSHRCSTIIRPAARRFLKNF